MGGEEETCFSSLVFYCRQCTRSSSSTDIVILTEEVTVEPCNTKYTEPLATVVPDAATLSVS